MNDKVYNRLKTEKDRPRTATLKEAQNHILPRINELFSSFWESQTAELGVDKKSLTAQKSRLDSALEKDPMLIKNWKKGKSKVSD